MLCARPLAVLYKEGDPIRYLYIIADGLVTLSQQLTDPVAPPHYHPQHPPSAMAASPTPIALGTLARPPPFPVLF